MVTQLHFLLADGTTFHAKGCVHDYSDFYREWMKSLDCMRSVLPKVYQAYRKFIDDNVFGEEEKEEVYPIEKEQRKFKEKFDADFSAARAKEKMRQQKGKNREEQEDTLDPADGSASESGGDEND